jgi:hypothetical protein
LAFLDEGAAYQDLAEPLLVEVAEGFIEGVSKSRGRQDRKSGRD